MMTSVALVASSFLPRFGGVEEHILNVAQRLRDRDHRVTVWSVDQGDTAVPESVDGIPVRYLPCPLPARQLVAAARAAAALPKAATAWLGAYRRDRPEVIHVQCYGPNGVYATVLARLLRTPLVVSTHGETMADAHGAFQTSALLRASLRRALPRAAAITAVSRFAADDLVRSFGMPPGATHIVPNGVDLTEPSAPRPTWLPDRYVLGVGRMVRNKGFDLLIDGFARLDRDDLSLVIGGEGPERTALHQQAARLGIGDRVLLPGRLTREEVVTTMAGAAVTVMPSRVEAFGIVALEAWRAGSPVVATVHGGPPEFIEDGVTGLLVDPEDPSALATALRRIVDDASFASAIAGAGRRQVASYTWAEVARRYELLYPSSARGETSPR